MFIKIQREDSKDGSHGYSVYECSHYSLHALSKEDSKRTGVILEMKSLTEKWEIPLESPKQNKKSVVAIVVYIMNDLGETIDKIMIQ